LIRKSLRGSGSCKHYWSYWIVHGTAVKCNASIFLVYPSCVIDVLTTPLLDHVKWRLFQQLAGNCRYFIIKGIWANQRIELFVRWLHAHAVLLEHDFPHLSQHQTSFQALCRTFIHTWPPVNMYAWLSIRCWQSCCFSLHRLWAWYVYCHTSISITLQMYS